MASIHWKFVALVVSIAVLGAPAAGAAPIKKDAESKIQLKLTDPSGAGIKFKAKGIAKVEKVRDKFKVQKIKFDLKDSKLGCLKLKSLKVEKFKLPVKGNKPKKDKSLILSYFDTASAGEKKTAEFGVSLLPMLNINQSGLVSGFSLDWLPNGPPVSDGDFALLNFSVSVPEPSTLFLLAAGLLGLIGVGAGKKGTRTV